MLIFQKLIFDRPPPPKWPTVHCVGLSSILALLALIGRRQLRIDVVHESQRAFASLTNACRRAPTVCRCSTTELS